MKTGCFIFGVIMVFLLPDLALADEYEGWDEIREALIDGDGAEFIVGADYPTFVGEEFEQLLAAANWVASHMEYVYDPDPPGDVWTSSHQQFDEIFTGIGASDWNGPGGVPDGVVDDYDKLSDGYYVGTGDCEDFSMLLCALARFAVGIPADRIWVQAGLLVDKEVGPPPTVGHAYVVYKAEKRGIFYIEPQWGGIPYRGSFPSILHWYYKRPPMAGESATLRFNDEWVKGGGFWLAGRR